MKNVRQRLIRTLVAGLLPLALASCVKEDFKNTPAGTDDAMVTFSLMLPGSSTPSSRAGTRALTDVQENHVQSIDVLLFEYDNGSGDGKFVDVARATGTSIGTDNTDGVSSRKKTFTVTMPQGHYDLVILANARDFIIRNDLKGTYKKATLASLETKAGWQGKWPADNTRPIPMWGYKDNVTISESTDLTGSNALSMTRMVARVDVKVNTAQVTNFKLTSVRVYNYNTRGAMVPANYWDTNYWNPSHTDGAQVVVPTVPASSTLTEGPLLYNGAAINTTDNQCVQEIYLYESENHTGAPHTNANKKGLLQRTCLVIGGKYGTDTDETFYRVDFSTGNGASQSYQDIRRNFWYTFQIDKVSGPGYDDPDVAYRSEPVNIEANVIEWNDGSMAEVNFDGQNMLAVSPGEFTFGKEAVTATSGDDNLLTITTDVPGGWSIDPSKIVYSPAGGDWLTLSGTSYGGNDKKSIELYLAANASGEPRTATIPVVAGRLKYNVMVTQTNTERKMSVFSFIEYTPAPGPMTAAGATVTAKVLTNMGWSFRTSIYGVKASMAEPADREAVEYTLAVDIPANLSWSTRNTDVWVECQGLEFERQTYTQLALYNIRLTAPASVGFAGGSTAFSLNGFFPAMNIRAMIGGAQVDITRSCVETGSISTGSSTSNVTFDIPANDRSARQVTIEYEMSPDVWVPVGTVKQGGAGGEADVLYFKADGTLAVGKWTDGTGTVTQANLAFFQFGSVVGFTNTGDAWAASKVRFNPVTGTPSYATYPDIPRHTTADWDANLKNISDNAYHNLANVKAGKGDPARLVGMTVAEIQAMTTDAELYAREAALKASGVGGWRTVTREENCLFVGGTTLAGAYNSTDRAFYPNPSTSDFSSFRDAPNSGRAYFPICADGNFIDNGYAPMFAAGLRGLTGAPTAAHMPLAIGNGGAYWSSTAYMNGTFPSGYFLAFRYNEVILDHSIITGTYGYGVRVLRP